MIGCKDTTPWDLNESSAPNASQVDQSYVRHREGGYTEYSNTMGGTKGGTCIGFSDITEKGGIIHFRLCVPLFERVTMIVLLMWIQLIL
mmetsp:Transcript_28106/g.40704  ORF Transcript_28106/g.40704 Transcript_28106/m.40704 type:complete len:89 (-) Transcript_28106:68-334(-)